VDLSRNLLLEARELTYCRLLRSEETFLYPRVTFLRSRLIIHFSYVRVVIAV